MNPCQLSFDETSQIEYREGLWQAIGSLTVYDSDYINTFRVFVSGETEALVRDFIIAQEADCGIYLEVTPDETDAEGDSGGAYDSPARSTSSPDFVLAHSQLNIGISRQNMQTPPPYRITYRVAMAPVPAADTIAAASFCPPPDEPEPGEKTLTKSVSFNLSEAHVRCEVKQGVVNVRLEENDGGVKPKIHGPVEVRAPAICWLPENRTIPQADCAEKKWQVIVEGFDSKTECYISYARREA